MDKKNGSSKKLSRIDKHERLFEMIRFLTAREFTGYLKVNFTQGGIGRIEKLEELALHRELVDK
jgi:hypothetical protein